MTQCILTSLPQELLCNVSRHLALEDVLRMRRVCKHTQGSIDRCTAWQQQYHRLYGEPQKKVTDPQQWFIQLKERYLAEASRNRVNRKVKMIKAHSAVQTARARVTDTKQQLEQQHKRKGNLQEELASIKRVRQASAAVQSWQPVTVRHFHQQLLESQPVESAWRERAVQQELQDVSLQLSTLQRGLARGRRELQEASRRLVALQP